MVDFTKLGSKSNRTTLINPRDIFQGLPRPKGVGDLYVSQAEILDSWFAKRNERRDAVVKQPTGGGKSLIGLLVATSILNERKRPVLFLTPTRQLVSQVAMEAEKFGVSVKTYLGGKGQGLPREFVEGAEICVTTYKALFNGKSKFGIEGRDLTPLELGGIICDDAHAAFDIIRDSFTLTIERAENGGLFDNICSLFQPSLREIGRTGTIEDIILGKDDGVIEVPYWAWQEHIDTIRLWIGKASGDSIGFVWPLLRDELLHCHAILSKEAISITPVLPFVEKFPSFSRCPQRVFMSATIADDSELIRTFGVQQESVLSPASSKSLAGVGERMILVPGLMKLKKGADQKSIVSDIVEYSKRRKHNLLVLTPSLSAAKKWEGECIVPTGADVDQVISRLQAAEYLGPVALVNRYDGIDLPGDACRILVLDGVPYGVSDYEKYRSIVLSGVAINSTLAQRLEQGIGRGARGAGDYCVVILVGNSLVDWLGRSGNEESLTSPTRLQLKIGRTVSGEVGSASEVISTISQALSRESGWKSYYASEMAAAAMPTEPKEVLLKVAVGERKAFDLERQNRFEEAVAIYDDIISKPIDDAYQGWFLQARARALSFLGKSTEAMNTQGRAHAVNRQLLRARIPTKYMTLGMPSAQAREICKRLSSFSHARGYIAATDVSLNALFTVSSANQYEEAVKQLGMILGFLGERPDRDYGLGPDVLWRTNEH